MWSLTPARSQNANPQVPQGGSATFDATSAQGPSSGWDILDPSGAIIASSPYTNSSGSDNGWTLQVNYNGYQALPGFTVTARANAVLGTGYRVRTAAYYWSAGTAFFDVVTGNTTTPTPTSTYPTPTPTSTYPTPTPTSTYPTPTPTYPTPTATPTSTYPTPTPTSSAQIDALIRTQSGTFQGDGVYNLDGNGQSATQTAVAGNPASYVVQLQNESANSAQIRLSASSVASGWTVRYFTGEGSGQNEITSYFNYYGHWDSPQLATGQRVEVRVEVEPSTTLSGGSVLELLLSAASTSDGVVRDAVKALTTNSSSAPPTPTPTPTTAPPLQLDAQIRLAGADDDHWNGSNVTNTDGSGQSEEQVTCAGKAAIFEIGIQNKGTSAVNFKLKSVDSGNDWTMRYFDAIGNGNEITVAMASANGWDTPSLAAGQHLLLRVEITGTAASSRDAVALVRVLDNSGNVIDAVRALAFRQSLARVEVSIDNGKTWQTATAAGVTKSLYGMVGFRAIKGDESLAWPYFPYTAELYPQWHTQNVTHSVDEIWVHCRSLADIPVTAVCGNSIATIIHVTPRHVTPRAE